MSQTQEEIQKINDKYINDIFPSEGKTNPNFSRILANSIRNGWTIRVEQFLEDDRFKPTYKDINAALILGEYEIVRLLFERKEIDFSESDNGLILYAMNNDMDDMVDLFWTDKRVQKKATENRNPKNKRILERFRKEKINKILKELK